MVKKIAKRIIPDCVINFINYLRSTTYPIIQNPDKEFEIVYKVKGTTWEDTYYAECYDHCKEQHLKVFSPAEYIFCIKDAIISDGSDVVFTDKGAYWGKYNQEEFVTWAIPFDKNVIDFDRNNIRVVRSKFQESIAGKVLPLIGLGSFHWVHCLYEFLPRLFTAGEAGLLNQPITILVIENEDPTIMEIINRYIVDFPDVKIRLAKTGIDYTCEELYFQFVSGPGNADYKFRLDYPWYIPNHVIEQTTKYVINPVIERIKDKKPKFEKIYLSRNLKYAKNGRSLINNDEVHNYFKKLGFVDIEGALLTLEEKAEIFYHAKEIVGLTGAALFNLIFCNQAKCMVFGNYRFATDSIGYSFFRDRVSSYVYVTGQDETEEYHSDFYISMDKIKNIYQEHIRG